MFGSTPMITMIFTCALSAFAGSNPSAEASTYTNTNATSIASNIAANFTSTMWAANYTTTVAWGNFSSVAFVNSSTVFVNGTQIYNWTATAAVIPTTAFHSDIPTGVSNGSALSTATATSINSTTAQQLSNSPTNGASRVTFGGLNVATVAGVAALISLL